MKAAPSIKSGAGIVARRLSLAAAALFATWPTLAQEGYLDLPKGYAEAYEATLADPTDLDGMFRLARRAESEALSTGSDELLRLAILLYERMRLVDSDLTEASLRLGELNFRRGNYVEAQAHFELALEDPRLPPAIARDARRYVVAIERELASDALTGTLSAGIRHRSNVIFLSDDIIFPEVNESDFDAYTVLDLRHRLDPGWQRGHLIETTFGAYYIRQFDLTDFNNAGANFTFGPRFSFASYGWGGASLRPFVTAGIIGFSDETYSREAGGGFEAALPIERRLVALVDFSAVYEWYGTVEGVPLDNLDGPDYRLNLTARFLPAQRVVLDATLGVRRDVAEDSSKSFWRYDAELAGRVGFTGPFELGAGDWTAAAAIGYARARYDFRDDEYFWSQLSAAVPLTRAVSLTGSLGLTERLSDDSAFDYDDRYAALGLALEF